MFPQRETDVDDMPRDFINSCTKIGLEAKLLQTSAATFSYGDKDLPDDVDKIIL